MRNNKIVEVNNEALYRELRTLWCDVFGDEPSYVDSFYGTFGPEIKGYIACSPDGTPASALTLYPCGSYEGRPVFVSYAICTREDLRGRGIGAELTSYVRDLVTESGAVSIVSPADPGLEDFYAALGYEPFFMASEQAAMSPEFDDEEYEDYGDFGEYEVDFGADGGDEPLTPALDVQRIDAETYNRYREAFLSGRPHIELSSAMLRLVESECEGLYSINRGDAICAVSETGPFRTVMSEFILNPVLEELSLGIDAEIIAMLAGHFGSAEIYYRTPGYGRCQSMAAGIGAGEAGNAEDGDAAYFGFPID